MLDYPGVLRRFSLGATHAIACRSDEEVQTTLLFFRYLSICACLLRQSEQQEAEKRSSLGKPGVERAKVGLKALWTLL